MPEVSSATLQEQHVSTHCSCCCCCCENNSSRHLPVTKQTGTKGRPQTAFFAVSSVAAATAAAAAAATATAAALAAAAAPGSKTPWP